MLEGVKLRYQLNILLCFRRDARSNVIELELLDNRFALSFGTAAVVFCRLLSAVIFEGSLGGTRSADELLLLDRQDCDLALFYDFVSEEVQLDSLSSLS